MKTKFYPTEIRIKGNRRSDSILKKLFFGLLLLLALKPVSSQTTSFSLTQIPFANADLIAPGRGVEHWNGAIWNDVFAPTVPAGNSTGLNTYYRFNWVDIENATQGGYNWTIFDNQINAAIDQGKMFSFGIMNMCTACGLGDLTYPAYLNTLMQSDPVVNNRDWQYLGSWIPNWNSEYFLSRWEALLMAVANHINTGSRNGVPYKNVIYYVDVRGYGDFGEWHTYPWTNTEPTGRKATIASLKRIIDAHITAFPNYPLIIPMGAFDTQHDSRVPAEVGYYALTAKNAWGEIGWRRDNLGDVGYGDWLEFNPASFNGVAFPTLIMNKWKFAPIGGEPNNDANSITAGGTQPAHFDLPNEMSKFHISHFGNGNYPLMNAGLRANVVEASKVSGYRLILESGNVNSNLIVNNPFTVNLNWKNVGVAPVYENWNVVYELRNATTNATVWSGTSAFKPKFFLPQATATTATDVFTLTGTIPVGSYKLVLVVKDPLGYKKPLPLAMSGRATDGSYTLATVNVVTGTGNQLPVANAGADKSITLPTSSVSLTGTGTDPDGTIASYSWTKIAGPAVGTIASPAAATTSITGLTTAGTYTFRLTVTDNIGATATDDVLVTVNSAPVTGGTVVANAGPDQALAATATNGTLQGSYSTSDSVDLIVIWGESNAGGIGENSSATAAELAPRTNVKIYNKNTTNFETLDVGTNNNIGQYIVRPDTAHGMELGLANMVDSGLFKNPVYLIKLGASGSYIQQWLPGDARDLWGEYIPQMDAAIAKLNAAGLKYRITVWSSIGLNDKFGQGLAPATWRTRMESFISSFRTRFGTYIPFFLMDFYNNPSQTSWDWRSTLDAMATADNRLRVVPAQGATYVDGSTHFAYAGFKLLAQRMADTTLSYWKTSISWSKVSGPAGGTIARPNRPVTPVSSLTTGTYVYRLSVTSNGTTVTDDVNIVVGSGGGNQAPVANAGADQSITLPTNVVTLSGSGTDPDGTVSSYAWTKISGGAATITSPSSAVTTITGLSAGTYVFQLTVTDNGGATASDQVQITVASNPLARPAPPTLVSITSNASVTNTVGVNLTGVPAGALIVLTVAQADDATFANAVINSTPALTWTLNANAGVPSSGNAEIFTAVYAPGGNLSITATQGNTAISASAYIITNYDVNYAGAVATIGGQALPNLPITSTKDSSLLIAVTSDWDAIDGAGRVYVGAPVETQYQRISTAYSAYHFRKQTGAAGTYTLGLSAPGGQAASTAILEIKGGDVIPSNIVPNAIAGADITITLPVSTATLNGSASNDPDGTITSYAWTKIAGPAGGTIAAATSASTGISALTQGTYSFRLVVTDNKGATDADTVNVIVNAAPVVNQAPNANAGADITITLPVSTATLNGSASNDPDGTIVTYAWTKLSGPAGGTISAASSASTGISALAQGTYSYRLVVTDNSGATDADTVNVIVNAAPVVNQAPNANAGADITITLPVSTATLNGSASNDPDGTIVTYAWTKLSGPAGGTISAASSASTGISALAQGTYSYRLVVTDNSGATDADTVNVIVNAAPVVNQAPNANAGVNITVTLPVNTATLNGSASNDPDGSITSFAWSKLAGPAGGTIAAPAAVTTGISGLIAGTYTYQLIVTDNLGARDTATVSVIVNSAANQSPIANAGPDFSITLPSDIALDGSASRDPDGTITGWNWVRISGPGSITILNSNTSKPTVTGANQGTYVFELTVTDNLGVTATDRVIVVVNAAAAATNKAPSAKAKKTATTTTVSSTTVTLSGVDSYDPDGNIVSYSWKQVSGPTTATIQNANMVQTDAAGLANGDYKFELTVTDDKGDKGRDTLTISVVDLQRSTAGLTLYPNPARNSINLRLSTAMLGNTKINLYDNRGNVLQTLTAVKNVDMITKELGISRLKNGLYYIEVIVAGKQKYIGKFMKQ